MKIRLLAVLAAALIVLGVGVVLAEDLYNNTLAVRSISPVTVSNDDNTVGQIIDRLGYSSLLYIINVATVADTDATFTPTLEHCAAANCSDAAEVADANLRGTEALATFGIADNNAVYMLEYAGSKRYTRLTVTPASNTGAATFSAIAIKGFPQYRPVVR
jgi:hypothetical protein